MKNRAFVDESVRFKAANEIRVTDESGRSMRLSDLEPNDLICIIWKSSSESDISYGLVESAGRSYLKAKTAKGTLPWTSELKLKNIREIVLLGKRCSFLFEVVISQREHICECEEKFDELKSIFERL